MKNIKRIVYFGVLIMCYDVYPMFLTRKGIINEREWVALSPEKKNSQVRLLVEDIYKLRELRRESLSYSQKKQEIKKEFSEALGLSDFNKLKLLLDIDRCSGGININQQIDFCINDSHFQALPLVIAASIVVNVEIVKLFLEKGAIGNFPDGSLLRHMLVALNDDESFWVTKSCDRELSGIILNRYVEVLEYLLNHFEFEEYKDEDSRECVDSWKLVIERVAEQRRFLDFKLLRHFSVLTQRFFPNVFTKKH